MLFKVIVFICLSAQGYCASWRVNGVLPLDPTRIVFISTNGTISVGSETGTLISNLTFSAWQNDAYYKNTLTWVRTTDIDGHPYIKITGYKGSEIFVYIPQFLEGLPVKEIGEFAFSGNNTIETLTLPANDDFKIGTRAFFECESLNFVRVDGVCSVYDEAFAYCQNLSIVLFEQDVHFLDACFIGSGGAYGGTLDVTFKESVYNYGSGLFQNSDGLRNLYFKTSNQPDEEPFTFHGLATNQVTIHVTNPTATWGATWNGMPVVRMPVHADRVSVGPSIGGLQAYLTSNGTNLFFVNVNSQTNAITSN